jgi:Haem-binding uptake, Tiki superfamily, ChaN
MKRAFYRFLLRLHPVAFRERFMDEMLWIFDETAEEGGLRAFADGLSSLVRQWAWHSNVWKMASATVLSCLLLTGWWHLQQAALASALRRGNPEMLEEIKHRRPTGMPCPEVPGEVAKARATEPHPPGEPLCDVADAAQGIIAAFRQHPVVMIGEVHSIRRAGDFYIRLIREGKFQETVEDIVVEFASRNNQPLLDRYIAGEDLPVDELRRIWRDTTKVAYWESPIYAEWLAAIREVNQGLPPSRRLRVLAGDTAVDWKNVHTSSDWIALGDNDVSFADVIVNEIVSKKHRALVVLGMDHVLKSGGPNGELDTATRVESRYPGSSYVVLLDSRGVLQPAVRELVRFHRLREDVPILCVLQGTPLGEAGEGGRLPLVRMADALLYLGPPEMLTRAWPPPGSLEPAYLGEVDRRSTIEWGDRRARRFLGAAAQ